MSSENNNLDRMLQEYDWRFFSEWDDYSCDWEVWRNPYPCEYNAGSTSRPNKVYIMSCEGVYDRRLLDRLWGGDERNSANKPVGQQVAEMFARNKKKEHEATFGTTEERGVEGQKMEKYVFDKGLVHTSAGKLSK